MGERVPAGVDASRPSAARMYDYGLGGKDNFEIDRRVVARLQADMPESMGVPRINRAMHRRIVRHLAGEAGIRQFIDLGSGLPTRDNTHQVAERFGGEARVVYVEHDPMVVVHANALLGGDRVGVVPGDLRDVKAVLEHEGTRRLIDFSEPVGVLFVAILHQFSDDEDPEGIVRAYMDAVPSGSHLVVSHFHRGAPGAEAIERRLLETVGSGYHRTMEQIQRYFLDMEMADPGLVYASRWRPDPAFDREVFPEAAAPLNGADGEPSPTDRLIVGGVARKP